MKTVDEQLDEALARVKALESDAKAGANLLAEASAKTEAMSLQLTELQAERERLDADLLAARQSIESLTKQKGEAETRLGELVARNKTLESREQDIEVRASRRAAEIVASTGTTAPAPVTPKGDRQTEDLVARFKAINDPKEQTIFWRSLTAQQQALILNSGNQQQ
jgi:chromosome segregation ATPase